ncbi:unnamed protein product [Closterium sp. NIES-54]
MSPLHETPVAVTPTILFPLYCDPLPACPSQVAKQHLVLVVGLPRLDSFTVDAPTARDPHHDPPPALCAGPDLVLVVGLPHLDSFTVDAPIARDPDHDLPPALCLSVAPLPSVCVTPGLPSCPSLPPRWRRSIWWQSSIWCCWCGVAALPGLVFSWCSYYPYFKPLPPCLSPLPSQVAKQYLVLVVGLPRLDSFTVDAPIARDPDHEFARMAVAAEEVEDRNGEVGAEEGGEGSVVATPQGGPIARDPDHEFTHMFVAADEVGERSGEVGTENCGDGSVRKTPQRPPVARDPDHEFARMVVGEEARKRRKEVTEEQREGMGESGAEELGARGQGTGEETDGREGCHCCCHLRTSSWLLAAAALFTSFLPGASVYVPGVSVPDTRALFVLSLTNYSSRSFTSCDLSPRHKSVRILLHQSQAPTIMPQPKPSSQLWQDFAFSDIIGEGQYGKVWRCVDRASGQPMACKQIRTAGLSESEMADLQREIYSLSLLGSHENILSLAHVYADDKTVYLVTELCSGGDLFDLVDRSGNGLDEASAAKIFVQIIRAVRWCHAHRIVHRDIKPENILLTKSTTINAATTGSSSISIADNLSVRLADFGLAFQLKPGCAMVGIGGSMPYEAPEMLAEQPYNTKADVWSLGVLLYSMLTSTWPAFPGNRRQLTPNDFRSAGWAKLSIAARDLICRMMIVDPAQRSDIDGVMSHPWLAHARRAVFPRQASQVFPSQPSQQQVSQQQSQQLEAVVAQLKNDTAATTTCDEQDLHAAEPLTQLRQPNMSPKQQRLSAGRLTSAARSATAASKAKRDAAASLLELVVRSLQSQPSSSTTTGLATASPSSSPAVSPDHTHPKKIPRTGDSSDVFATNSAETSETISYQDLLPVKSDFNEDATSAYKWRLASLRAFQADSARSISASSSGSSSGVSEFFTPISSPEPRQKPSYHQFLRPRPSLLGVQI